MQTYRQMLTELAPDAVFARQEGVSYPTFQKYTYYSHTAHRDTPVNMSSSVRMRKRTEDRSLPFFYYVLW